LAAPVRTLLLGRRDRLLSGDWPERAPALAALLARGLAFEGGAGDEPALARVVDLAGPDGAWPIAALTRIIDQGDCGRSTWLRADPAYVRADAACARLLAIGDFEIPRADADAALAVLVPLFAEEGILLDAPHPHRWYLRVPDGTAMPRFAHPREVLGDDLSRHLPDGPAARRWVRLLNEVQMTLHQAEFNRARASRGLPPINSLGFWGGGRAPERVSLRAARVATDDPILLGALRLAARAPVDYAAAAPAGPDDSVVDLRRLDDVDVLDSDWLRSDLAALKRRRFACIELVFADGSGVRVDTSQAWRLWRRRPN
jgi:hypothetical protein